MLLPKKPVPNMTGQATADAPGPCLGQHAPRLQVMGALVYSKVQSVLALVGEVHSLGLTWKKREPVLAL